MGKTMEHSMGNPWKIHGKSLENKNEKKEMFPWFSMPNKNAHKFLGSTPPKNGPKTGIRFDTKWHHNWLNQLLIWRISIIFRRASFLFSKKNGFWVSGTKKEESVTNSVYRKISFPENVEKLSFRCHVRWNRLKICMYDRMRRAVILETPKPPQFQPELSKNRFLWIFGFSSFLT